MSDKGKIYLVLIVAAVAVAFYFIMDSSKRLAVSPTPSPSPTTTPDAIAYWRTFLNEYSGFEFKYPNNFLLREDGTMVSLEHSVPHKYSDPCDLKDGTRMLDKVVDFNAKYEVVNVKPEEAVQSKLSYLANDILLNGKIRPELAYSVGNLKGYKHEMGAEGCGLETYFFEVNNEGTLVVERQLSPERTLLITNYQKFLALPGIITPEEEIKIFNQILATFKDLAHQPCLQVITRARNPLTGEEKDFPTPCDVPLSWEKI